MRAPAHSPSTPSAAADPEEPDWPRRSVEKRLPGLAVIVASYERQETVDADDIPCVQEISEDLKSLESSINIQFQLSST